MNVEAASRNVYWIASYPKSGNTWVRLLLCSLAAGGGAPDFDQLGKICPNPCSLRWVEDTIGISTAALTMAEKDRLRVEACRMHRLHAASPICLKVHDRYDFSLMPPELTAGIVYIVRDPRDVAPSWADHMGVSLDEAIRRMSMTDFALLAENDRFYDQTRQRLGSWSSHVNSWLDMPRAPILLLRYEDMLEDAVGTVTRLARFVNMPCTAAMAVSAVAACRFAALREREAQQGFLERQRHQPRFFRQGLAGAWEGTLSRHQATLLAAHHGETMQRLAYGVEPSGS